MRLLEKPPVDQWGDNGGGSVCKVIDGIVGQQVNPGDPLDIGLLVGDLFRLQIQVRGLEGCPQNGVKEGAEDPTEYTQRN